MVPAGLHHVAPHSVQITYTTLSKSFLITSVLCSVRSMKTRQIVALLNVITASEMWPPKFKNANYCHFSLYKIYLSLL